VRAYGAAGLLTLGLDTLKALCIVI